MGSPVLLFRISYIVIFQQNENEAGMVLFDSFIILIAVVEDKTAFPTAVMSCNHSMNIKSLYFFAKLLVTEPFFFAKTFESPLQHVYLFYK